MKPFKIPRFFCCAINPAPLLPPRVFVIKLIIKITTTAQTVKIGLMVSIEMKTLINVTIELKS